MGTDDDDGVRDDDVSDGDGDGDGGDRRRSERTDDGASIVGEKVSSDFNRQATLFWRQLGKGIVRD